jgi:hypothetical protein
MGFLSKVYRRTNAVRAAGRLCALLDRNLPYSFVTLTEMPARGRNLARKPTAIAAKLSCFSNNPSNWSCDRRHCAMSSEYEVSAHKKEPDCSQARFRFPESSTFSRVLTFGVTMARLSVRSDVCTSPPDKKPKKNRPAWVRALDSALFHVLATCSFLHARGYRFLRRYRLHPATLLLSLYVTSGALTMLPGDAKLVHGLIDIAIGITHWLA